MGFYKSQDLKVKRLLLGSALVLQRLRLCARKSEGTGLIPGQGSKISQAAMHSLKKGYC